MRFYYNHIVRARQYRRAGPFMRRMIEVRYTVARTVRAHRQQAKISQKRLAYLLDAAPSTISAIERASPRVSLTQAVRALIALGVDDDGLGAAFNPGLRRDVHTLRHVSKTLHDRFESPAQKKPGD